MRSTRTLLIVAGILFVGGLLLVATSNDGGSYGWFAYAPESVTISSDSAYLLTTRAVIGWGATWLASLILTGVVVRRVVRRRPPADESHQK